MNISARLRITICIASVVMASLSLTSCAQPGTFVATTKPSNPNPGYGEQLTVDVILDMSRVDEPDNKLGSFTSALIWDPAVICYVSNSGLLSGFTGMVNDKDVSFGRLVLNGISPGGVGGQFVVMTMTFGACGKLDSSTALELEFTVAASAVTFKNLLPMLSVETGTVTISGTRLSDNQGCGDWPDDHVLKQNYPNPFNCATVIDFQISDAMSRGAVHSMLRVYNSLGQVVRTLVDEVNEPGYFSVLWNGRDNAGEELSSGVYFSRFEVEDHVQTRRMLLLR